MEKRGTFDLKNGFTGYDDYIASTQFWRDGMTPGTTKHEKVPLPPGARTHGASFYKSEPNRA